MRIYEIINFVHYVFEKFMALQLKTALKTFLAAIATFSVAAVAFVFLVELVVYSFLNDPDKPIINPKDYSAALERISEKKNIAHFPKKIPENAKNVYLYSFTEYNKEIMLLQFSTDKEFIQKELKSHSFINADTPVGAPQKRYKIPNFYEKKIEGMTLYVLKRNEDEEFFKSYYTYFTGIGVDKTFSNILYFYYVESLD